VFIDSFRLVKPELPSLLSRRTVYLTLHYRGFLIPSKVHFLSLDRNLVYRYNPNTR